MIIDVGSFDADVSSSSTSSSDNLERSGEIKSLSKKVLSSKEEDPGGESLELEVGKIAES